MTAFLIDEYDAKLIDVMARAGLKSPERWPVRDDSLDAKNEPIIEYIDGFAYVARERLTENQERELIRVLKLLALKALDVSVSLEADYNRKTGAVLDFCDQIKQRYEIKG